ncbi:hypothetical protein MHYP_G00201870 [Metynnis hypsauchen]
MDPSEHGDLQCTAVVCVVLSPITSGTLPWRVDGVKECIPLMVLMLTRTVFPETSAAGSPWLGQHIPALDLFEQCGSMVFLRVEKCMINVLEMSCKTFSIKSDTICTSYKECGFSYRLNSTYTSCKISKEKGKLSVECSVELTGDKCKSDQCGWKENENFKNIDNAKCRTSFKAFNGTNFMKNVQEVDLHVKDSMLYRLHLEHDKQSPSTKDTKNHTTQEDGSTASQNASVSCDGICIALPCGGKCIATVVAGVSIVLNVVLIGCLCRKRNERTDDQVLELDHLNSQGSPSEGSSSEGAPSEGAPSGATSKQQNKKKASKKQPKKSSPTKRRGHK